MSGDNGPIASVMIQKQPPTKQLKPAVTGMSMPPDPTPPPPVDLTGPTMAAASKDVPESAPIAEIIDNIKPRDEGLKITKREVGDRLNEVVQQKRAAGAGNRLNRYDLAYIFGFTDKGDWSLRGSLKHNGWGADTSKFTEEAYNTFTGDYQNNGTIDPRGLLEALTCYAKYNYGILQLNLSHFVELKTIRKIPVGELTGRLKDIAKNPNQLLAFCRTNFRFLREFMAQTASEAEDTEWKRYKEMKTPGELIADKDFTDIFTDPAKYETLKIMSLALFVDMSNHFDVNKIEPPKEKYLQDPLARKLYVDTIFDTYIVAGRMDKEATESAVNAVEKFGKDIGKLRDFLSSHGYDSAGIDKLLDGLAPADLNKVFPLKDKDKVPALEKLQKDKGTAAAYKSDTPAKPAQPVEETPRPTSHNETRPRIRLVG